MLHSFYGAALLSLTVALAGCDVVETRVAFEQRSDNLLYRNSFESSSDVAGWAGNGTLEVRNEAPVGGGAWSAYISGGCLYPHSAMMLESPLDGNLSLRVWGKNLGIGGSVALENLDTGLQVFVPVTEKDWRREQSETLLPVGKGDRLQLSMGAGGIVASAMMVTLLEVAVAE
jgi:hypothetical protein